MLNIINKKYIIDDKSKILNTVLNVVNQCGIVVSNY